ncbi:hypothetical protein SADUNF_Sadunf16G0272500 [Salix dunnii]|uniref:Uncharacterized protein n=1 Tax=Salix dunnii TaxID=1413687 RepID=A0A835JDL4_9ROSI|nr:hypothetical protein SADUNF_Sadunf16G0272500 [Salix dunnii]
MEIAMRKGLIKSFTNITMLLVNIFFLFLSVASAVQDRVLLLINGNNHIIWSSNTTKNVESPILQLLDSGNLVVKDGKDNSFILWQSFEYPCDKFLPGMKIGWNSVTGVDRYLTSWKSADDPGPGRFSFGIDHQGFPQLVVRNGTLKHYRLGSWNGKYFTGTPDMQVVPFLKVEFIFNKTYAHYSCEIANSAVLLTRLILNPSGFMERSVLQPQFNDWTRVFAAPSDLCDNYSVCGAYMSCKMVDQSHNCTCLEGFEPKSLTDLSRGCTRRSALNCTYDIFQNFSGFKLPDTSNSWYDTSMSSEECKHMCLKNCTCSAYANSNITGEGSGCVLWFGELVDMKEFGTADQDLYIRMPPPPKTDKTTEKTNFGKKKLVGIALSSTVLAGLLMVGLSFYIWRKKQKRQEIEEDMELPSFDLATIVKATDNFSSNNKLGQGGFGPAWKLWVEERALELVENMSDRPYSVPDVLRCIHVGLLCVQQKPEDRPNMSSVVLMLGSENSLPDPKQPGFFTERNMPALDSSTGNHESSSINDLTISVPEGR